MILLASVSSVSTALMLEGGNANFPGTLELRVAGIALFVYHQPHCLGAGVYVLYPVLGLGQAYLRQQPTSAEALLRWDY